MKPRKPLTWPPKVGHRICLDSGHEHTSWSAEVRAIVDEDYAVIKRWRAHKGWHVYEVLDRLQVETFNSRQAMFFEGPLPRTSSAQKDGGT
jgi:hypothetical protein